MELAQDHLNAIGALTELEAKRLLRKYKQIRQDLRDRLDTFSDDTFTAQQLRSVLLQVETAVDAMSRSLNTEMSESAEKAALLGSENLIREVNEYNQIFSGAASPINLNAALIATDTKNFLFNKYSTSIDAYSAQTRSMMADQLSNAVIEKITLSEVVRRIGRYFQAEEWKLNQIARTELHGVYNTAKQNTLFESAKELPDLMKTLIHPMDSRTGEDSKQAAAKNMIVPVDEPFVYTYRRKTKAGYVNEKRIFMTPPDRPNDRSIMVPYRKVWE